MRFEMEAPSPRSFPGALAQYGLGPLRLYDFSGPAHRIRRRPASIKAGEASFFLAVTPLLGECHLVAPDRACVLAPGDMLFLHAGRPFEMNFPIDMRLRVVVIPAPLLTGSTLACCDTVTLVAPAGMGTTAICQAFLESVYANREQLSGAEERRISRTLVSLLDTVASAAMEADGVSPNAARTRHLARITACVRDRLAEPDLDAHAIAQDVGVSQRYLRDLLRWRGTTLRKLLLELRLARCREALVDPLNRYRPVGEIGYAWGFNSQAHFTRAFSDCYGLPPARFRRASSFPDDNG